MYHKKEIERWANCPEGTKVWGRSKRCPGEWKKLDYPKWLEENEYIVDDAYAEKRKKWVELGRPTVQCLSRKGIWEDCETEPEWTLHPRKYRIKPSEWYEDIPRNGILCWVGNKHDGILYMVDLIIRYDYREGVDRPYIGSTGTWEVAKPMAKEEADSLLYNK